MIFFLYILFCVTTVYCAHFLCVLCVFSMYFIGVSGLRVLPLLIKWIDGWMESIPHVIRSNQISPYKTILHVLKRSVPIVVQVQNYNRIINNNNSKTMFMVLSSWQSHCESSPGSSDECRTAPSGRRTKTKPDDSGYE